MDANNTSYHDCMGLLTAAAWVRLQHPEQPMGDRLLRAGERALGAWWAGAPAERRDPDERRSRHDFGDRDLYVLRPDLVLDREPLARALLPAVIEWEPASTVEVLAAESYVFVITDLEIGHPLELRFRLHGQPETRPRRRESAFAPKHPDLALGTSGFVAAAGDVRFLGDPGEGATLALSQVQAVVMSNRSGHYRCDGGMFPVVERWLGYAGLPWFVFVDHAARRVRAHLPGLGV
jgi:hypothetical protein